MALSSAGFRKDAGKKDGLAVDSLLNIELDVAQALAEFSRIAHLPARDFAITKGHCEENAPLLKWSEKRKRSTRICKKATSSKLDRKCDLSLVDDNLPIPFAIIAELNKSSACGGRSLEANVQKLDLFLKMEIDEQVSKSVPKAESASSDYIAESPSSPLPPSQLECTASLVTATDSAFQGVVPSRTNEDLLLPPFKPKVEDVSYKEHSANMYTAKLAVKRKPRLCKPISFVSSEVVQSVEIRLSTLSAQQSSDTWCNELSFRSSSLSRDLPMDHGTEAIARMRHPLKMKCRKGGHLVVNRSKPALTKVEIEARRVRRLQANRESARQTLRKKQVLCEELSQRASTLKLENEDMKKEKERLLQELSALSERNCQLKEQLKVQSDSELGPSLLSQSTSLPLQQISLLPLPFPMIPYDGVSLQPFIQYHSLAQPAASRQASMQEKCDVISGTDYSSITNSNGLVPGLWMRTDGDNHPFLIPPSFIDHLSQFPVPCAEKQPSSIDNLPASSCQMLSSMEQKEGIKSGKDPVQNADLSLYGVEEYSESQGAQRKIKAAQLASDDACFLALNLKSGSCHSGIAVASTLKSQSSKVLMPMGVSTLTKRQLAEVVTSRCLGHTTMQFLTGSGDRSILEGSQQTCSFTGHKFPATAAAATEARRRRKELIRNKIFHSRQLRLPC